MDIKKLNKNIVIESLSSAGNNFVDCFPAMPLVSLTLHHDKSAALLGATALD